MAKALAQLQERTGVAPSLTPEKAVAVIRDLAAMEVRESGSWRVADFVASMSFFGIGGLAWKGGSIAWASLYAS